MLIIQNTFCADHYKIGDQLYVWARNGINVRKGPGTNYPIIKAIAFGDSVIISDTTLMRYNLTAIEANMEQDSNHKVDPLILRGYWVKITFGLNLSGYVIDQYLLSIKPGNLNGQDAYELNFLKIIAIDTTWKNPVKNHGNEPHYCLRITFDKNITRSSCPSEMGSDVGYEFPGFSIEEVVIFFSSALNNFNDCYVYTNWKEKLVIQQEICTWTIINKNDTIVVYNYCNC
ncbi:MAG: SH3 domain-containing protein [Saprospiraceae bacterium]|uniref:SH3 domain-containing protein n=1 Tax=Candidatus Opimibacter skivensis TaxID=2982028 RepID=A0A9D7SVL1_9BACT|nr:SH3 domain-containing protein [Candidatus Opimibacter skivensis]